MINESNYHFYLDDFVNGLLDEELEMEFVAFLDRHPGILDGEEVETPVFSLDAAFKNSLKKEMPLDKANVDEWMVASLEGDLNPAQEKQLDAYIQKHPALEKDRSIFALTKLEADAAVIFPNKEKLKHRPAIYLYARWSAAAAAVLLIGFVFFRPSTMPPPEHLTNLPDEPVKVEAPVEAGKEKQDVVASKKGNPFENTSGQNAIVQEEDEQAVAYRENKNEISPKEMQPMELPTLPTVLPDRIAIPGVADQLAYQDTPEGQSVWQWAYKKIRKRAGAEEIAIPEREIPADAFNLVLSKVAPNVSFDQDDKGSVLKIGSFEINRKTAKN